MNNGANNRFNYYYDSGKNELVYYKKTKKKNGFLKNFLLGVLIIGLTAGSFTLGNAFAAKNVEDKVQELLAKELQSAEQGSTTVLNASNQNISLITDAAGGSNEDNTIAIIEEVSKAVVSINTKMKTDYYFGGGGSGSGVIIYEDDTKIYIVTNNHVIDGAGAVSISVDDDILVTANYVGTNESEDIAVISVTKSEMIAAGITDYKIAKFANSTALKVGQTVIAIGNAAGEGKSATKGIISAVNKDITIEGITLNVLQTDAAINPGNSGGALVDMSGSVVGINTAKYSGAGMGRGAIEGMGYSIPSNKVKELVEGMISGTATGQQEPTTPYLGISGDDVTQDMAATYNVPFGAYVSRVSEKSNLVKAGLKSGDIIVAINDVTVSSYEDLKVQIQKHTVGTEVEIEVYRLSEKGNLKFKTVLQSYNELNRF